MKKSFLADFNASKTLVYIKTGKDFLLEVLIAIHRIAAKFSKKYRKKGTGPLLQAFMLFTNKHTQRSTQALCEGIGFFLSSSAALKEYLLKSKISAKERLCRILVLPIGLLYILIGTPLLSFARFKYPLSEAELKEVFENKEHENYDNYRNYSPLFTDNGSNSEESKNFSL